MKSTQFMNWVDFDEHRGKTDLVLVPFGAVEVYGPHLPLGADGIATQALAEQVSEQEPAFVAPLIPVGYSRNLQDFPGTLSVRPSSLVAYTRDVVESYILWGCKRVLFINGHAGNVAHLQALSVELEDEHHIRCAQIDWWRFIQPLVSDLVEADAMPHGHASEFGTSVMLHLALEHVKMERAVRELPATEDPYPDFIRQRKYGERSTTGVIGDGTVGTVEKGRETLERATRRVVEFLRSDSFATPTGQLSNELTKSTG